MTQLELARRALKTAQTHLRLASSLMTLDAETRDNVRALQDDVVWHWLTWPPLAGMRRCTLRWFGSGGAANDARLLLRFLRRRGLWLGPRLLGGVACCAVCAWTSNPWRCGVSDIENTEAIRLLHINRLPCEFWLGRWHWPSGATALAVVTYASEPSPETGHVGWCWWALGKMGDAPTYAEAIKAAECHLAEVRRE